MNFEKNSEPAQNPEDKTGAEPKLENPKEDPDKEKKDLSELKDRLQLLIQSISGKLDLKVTTEIDPRNYMRMLAEGSRDPDQEWFRQSRLDPITRKQIGELVHIPPTIFESTEEVAKGKAAHEASHVAITRFGEFVPDKVLQKTGFHMLMASAEERPTDQAVRNRYEGAGLWVDEARRDSGSNMTISEEARTKMGYVPHSQQLSNLIVYEPHYTKEQKSLYSPEVLELYEEMREDIEKIEHTLPKEKSSPKEILAKARERYKTVYTKLWPKFEKLIAADLEKEKLRQMASEAMRQESEKKEPGEKDGQAPSENKEKGEQAPENPLNQLPNDLKEELKKALEKVGQEAKQETKGGQPEESAGATETKEGQTENPEETAESSGGEDAEKSKPGQSKDGTENGQPLPMDKLSPELLEALEKIFKSLPQNVQEALRDQARKTLEAIEDQIVKEMGAKLADHPAETHEESSRREERELREGIEQEKIEAERERIEREQAAMLENMDDYERTYTEVSALDEKLFRELNAIFKPNIKSQVQFKSAGSKINLPAVFRWEAQKNTGRLTDNRIFETVTLPERKDYAITLLVDLSGSMSGQKIQETFKGVVLLTEVLNRLGINFELLGFQDEVIGFKKFNEDLSDTTRKKISGMRGEVSGQNPGGHNKGAYNDDGPCLLEASESLGKQPGKEKFLIVFSDGLPEGCRSNGNDLTKAVEKITKTTNQKLVGLGLGWGTDHVKTYYPASLPNIQIKDLSEVMGNLLEDLILHPQKYSSHEEP